MALQEKLNTNNGYNGIDSAIKKQITSDSTKAHQIFCPVIQRL